MTAIIDISLFNEFLYKLNHGIKNISKIWFIENELVPDSICKCIIKRGANKGNPCFKKSKFNNGLCGRHYKSKNIYQNCFKGITTSTQTNSISDDERSVYSETSTLIDQNDEIVTENKNIINMIPINKFKKEDLNKDKSKKNINDNIKVISQKEINYVNSLQFIERSKEEDIQDYMKRIESNVIRYAENIKKANLKSKLEQNIMININKDFNPNNVKFRMSPKRNMYINMMRRIINSIPK